MWNFEWIYDVFLERIFDLTFGCNLDLPFELMFGLNTNVYHVQGV